jgi:hypothetical protein
MNKKIIENIYNNLHLKFDYISKTEHKVPIMEAIEEAFEKGFKEGQTNSETEKWKQISEAAIRNQNSIQTKHDMMKERMSKANKIFEETVNKFKELEKI